METVNLCEKPSRREWGQHEMNAVWNSCRWSPRLKAASPSLTPVQLWWAFPSLLTASLCRGLTQRVGVWRPWRQTLSQKGMRVGRWMSQHSSFRRTAQGIPHGFSESPLQSLPTVSPIVTGSIVYLYWLFVLPSSLSPFLSPLPQITSHINSLHPRPCFRLLGELIACHSISELVEGRKRGREGRSGRRGRREGRREGGREDGWLDGREGGETLRTMLQTGASLFGCSQGHCL